MDESTWTCFLMWFDIVSSNQFRDTFQLQRQTDTTVDYRKIKTEMMWRKVQPVCRTALFMKCIEDKTIILKSKLVVSSFLFLKANDVRSESLKHEEATRGCVKCVRTNSVGEHSPKTEYLSSRPEPWCNLAEPSINIHYYIWSSH